MIQDKSKVFEPGNKVHYVPAHIRNSQPKNGWNVQNGIVKSVRGETVFVVYECGENWEHYSNYTAASTRSEDLDHGWI
jgi:hypothetical protein